MIMADTGRAIFPDPRHPLYTEDPTAQQQVAERIKEAKKGPDKFLRDGMEVTFPDGATGTYHGDGIEPAPLGQRVRVTNDDIARRLGVSRRTATAYVNQPQKMDEEKACLLCKLLCVDMDELRYGFVGWGLPPYGADTIAEAYDMLSREDKRLVSGVIQRCFSSYGNASAFVLAEERARKSGRWRL